MFNPIDFASDAAKFVGNVAEDTFEGGLKLAGDAIDFTGNMPTALLETATKLPFFGPVTGQVISVVDDFIKLPLPNFPGKTAGASGGTSGVGESGLDDLKPFTETIETLNSEIDDLKQKIAENPDDQFLQFELQDKLQQRMSMIQLVSTLLRQQFEEARTIINNLPRG